MKNFSFLICMTLFCMALIVFAVNPKINVLSAEPHSINVVALGDSISYGTGDSLRKGFVGRFKDMYEKYHGVTIDLSNFGVPKYRIEDTLKQLQDENILLRVKEANYIILNIGTNDFRKSAQYKFDHIDFYRMNEGKVKFSKSLQLALVKIRNDNASALVIVMGMYHPYTEYENHTQLFGLINNWNSEMRMIVNQFNNMIYVPTIDLFFHKPKESYFSDSLHPNSAGYELISKRLFEKLISLESPIN
jgi:lysophospholipase L1-like esterase